MRTHLSGPLTSQVPSFPQIGDLVSTDQPFGLSTAEYGFRRTPFDGVLGLNYPNLWEGKGKCSHLQIREVGLGLGWDALPLDPQRRIEAGLCPWWPTEG